MKPRLLMGVSALVLGITAAPAAAEVIIGGPIGYGVPSLIIVTGPSYFPGAFSTPFYIPFSAAPFRRGYGLTPNRRPAAGQGGGYGSGLGAGSRGDERFYLDPERPAAQPSRPERPARTESVRDLARRQLRVQRSDPGLYLVWWSGPAEDVLEVEYRAVDEKGQLLRSRVAGTQPFRGLLRVPDATAAVQVIVTSRTGATTSFQLPAADFKSLAE